MTDLAPAPSAPATAPTPATGKKPLHVILAAPRGFCAGVSRAIATVEHALTTYGAPVYVRHQIVHNQHVVRRLEAMGAIFVEHTDEIPQGATIVFSAHGAPASAIANAKKRANVFIDAACPLVLKVHSQVKRYVGQGHHIILIGHAGHPEVIGITGQVPDGHLTLVETPQDIEALPDYDGPLAYVTQTTLSQDETDHMIAALKAKFPDILAPTRADICYATTNRQHAVKAIAATVRAFLVVGSANSSNSNRLVETAQKAGARLARLIENPEDADLSWLDAEPALGISAGASTPEDLVEKLLLRLSQKFAITVQTLETATESLRFKPPVPHRG